MGVVATHTRLEPRPSDVFLASFPKSGTTWLKALAFATLNRAKNPPCDHPLRHRNSHDCVQSLGMAPRPRRTEVMCSRSSFILHACSPASGGRIVYICRDPKDALVSLWFFAKKMATTAARANDNPRPPTSFTIEEALELFCDGRCVAGPQWQHVVEYWEESRRRPDKVLFLRYEPGNAQRPYEQT
ncbi:hypothetical protein BRADI_2g18480v3 [Brachypodium distachyon]|uniref:Sulfotransferase n=1 Tax=Brachypodium distachyon TaxID=15368 RepID=I1HH48_BRADI|nr:hypothetical protein BRADI_2g18480v3 [Brachypodium distachyon]